MFKAVWIFTLFFTTGVTSSPIDLYNPDAVRPTDLRMARTDSGPGICKENLSNDNITGIRWYRYHNETHKCWHIDEQGPCGKMMLFYPIGNSEYGDCDCNFYYRCARPVLYWAASERCYFTNDQGPCNKDEWLVVGEDDLRPSCKANPCVQNQTVQPSSFDRYWFEEMGECYLTLTQGYCENPQEILYPKWEDFKPSCNIGRTCNSRSGRSSSSSLCIPGQKYDLSGKCRKPLRVNNWLQVS